MSRWPTLPLPLSPVISKEGKVTDYEMDPIAVADVITKVEAHIDPLETARDTLSTEIDDAAVACKRPEVSSALFSLWNELLMTQAEAAQTRVENACNAMTTAAAAFVDGDEEMLSEATAASAARPELDLEDGKKDAEA